MVIIFSTKKFKEAFTSEVNYEKFVQNFKEWKELASSGKESISFGKDAGYREPKLSSGYLMHVHTKPTSKIELANWELNFRRGSERTSDKALVYVKRGDSYLLIDWIRGNAHGETDYSPAGKARLENYAKVAEKFLSREEVQEHLKQLALEAKLLFSKSL